MVSLLNFLNLTIASSLFRNSGAKNRFIASSSSVLSDSPNPKLAFSISSAPKLDVKISIMFLQSAFLPLDPVIVP